MITITHVAAPGAGVGPTTTGLHRRVSASASSAAQQSIDNLDAQGTKGGLPARQMAVVVNALRAAAGEPQGQAESDATDMATAYIDTGVLPQGFEAQDLHDAEPTRAARALALLESCHAALSGPAANLLAVGGRTGVIVAMSVALRETIAYYLEKALDSNDTSEANRAWMTACMFMVGPCLNLLGLLREEWQGSASLRSRLGRSCMLCLTLASGLGVALQGGLARMTTSTAAGALYVITRDLVQTFFPLNSNVDAVNLAPTAAAAAVYGVFGGMLEWLTSYLPYSSSTGANGAARGLDYDLFGTMLQGLLAALHAVQDDLTLLWLNARAASTQPGDALSIRASARWPQLADLVGAFTQQGALRMSALHAINFVLAGVLMAAADSDEPHENHQAISISISVLVMLLIGIYLPVLCGQSSRAVDEPTLQSTRL